MHEMSRNKLGKCRKKFASYTLLILVLRIFSQSKHNFYIYIIVHIDKDFIKGTCTKFKDYVSRKKCYSNFTSRDICSIIFLDF